MTTAPLDDPAYTPVHRPVDGRIPDVVAKWGPRSQLRWFRRFQAQIAGGQDWGRFYCESEHHHGGCCYSCFEEGLAGDGWCCCYQAKEADADD